MSRLHSFDLYPACISPYPGYPAVSLYLSTSSHFAVEPLHPAVSHCIQLYPYISSCIIRLYPTVSHCIPPPRKRDITKNTLDTPGEGCAGSRAMSRSLESLSQKVCCAVCGRGDRRLWLSAVQGTGKQTHIRLRVNRSTVCHTGYIYTYMQTSPEPERGNNNTTTQQDKTTTTQHTQQKQQLITTMYVLSQH